MNEIWVPITVAIVAIVPSTLGRQIGRQVIMRDLEIIEKLPADSPTRARLLRDVERRIEKIVERRFTGFNGFDRMYLIAGVLALCTGGALMLARTAGGDTFWPLADVEILCMSIGLSAFGSVALGALLNSLRPRLREDEGVAARPQTRELADQSSAQGL